MRGMNNARLLPSGPRLELEIRPEPKFTRKHTPNSTEREKALRRPFLFFKQTYFRQSNRCLVFNCFVK